MYVNNGFGRPNYSQRNNEYDPDGSCNVTAAISAIVSAGWDIPPGHGQPEDRLHLFIEDDEECQKEYNKCDPDHTRPPHQWHVVLCLGVNRWMERAIARFSTMATADTIMSHLLNGGTGYTSGSFPTTQGHFVAFVGFEAKNLVPIKWIIKDPWGDYRTNYRVKIGDNIEMPHADFLRIIRPMDLENKLFTFIEPRR